MKNRYIALILAFVTLTFVSCDEDEELPEFLDGTEFGILLQVDVSGTDVILANINTSSISFDVTYDDTKRPVTSIVVQKSFIPAGGAASGKVEQMTVTTSPASATLSVSDLVSGISGLTVADIVAGDSFSINFITHYSDGLIVDTYGTGVNPNFTVTFANE